MVVNFVLLVSMGLFLTISFPSIIGFLNSIGWTFGAKQALEKRRDNPGEAKQEASQVTEAQGATEYPSPYSAESHPTGGPSTSPTCPSCFRPTLDRKYCINCGTQLKTECANQDCNETLEHYMRFCPECGTENPNYFGDYQEDGSGGGYPEAAGP